MPTLKDFQDRLPDFKREALKVMGVSGLDKTCAVSGHGEFLKNLVAKFAVESKLPFSPKSVIKIKLAFPHAFAVGKLAQHIDRHTKIAGSNLEHAAIVALHTANAQKLFGELVGIELNRAPLPTLVINQKLFDGAVLNVIDIASKS